MKNIFFRLTILFFLTASCTKLPAEFPANTTVHPVPPAPVFAYVIPSFGGQTINLFSVDLTTGLISNPTVAYTNAAHSYQQVTFATVSGVTYGYALDGTGLVYQCAINADKTFSSCNSVASLPPAFSWQGRSIEFATFNAQYAYIVDPGNNVVYQCGLTAGGDFVNCQQGLSPFYLPTMAPYEISFATSTLGVKQAYITDAGSGVGFGFVLMCLMNNDGSFNTCAQTPASGAPGWIPYDVTFTEVNGTQYAYVSDNGSGPPGHVYQCPLNSDGTFVNAGCVQTPANDNTLTNWYPYSVTFQTVNGVKYAYVVNNSGALIGNLYKCDVDAATGLFSNCVMTPGTLPGVWQPADITF